MSARRRTSNRKLIAIDPGPVESAVVEYMYDGTINWAQIENNEAIARWCSGGADLPYVGYSPDLVIEWVEYYGMTVGKDIFETIYWIGRFDQAWHTSVFRVTRREVKLHLCNSARAKDKNIRQALIDKIGPVGTKKNPGPLYGIKTHLWSALAVAVTFTERRG